MACSGLKVCIYFPADITRYGALTVPVSHHCYILLKVYIAANRQSSGVQTELAISDMLPQALRTHSRNPHHIRTVLDSFEISGTSHMCLVYEPAAMSLKDFQNDTGGGPLFPELVRSTIRCMLDAVDLLHTRGDYIHTGKYLYADKYVRD